MSGLNLNAIAENATRLGTRLQETISEHTRDLALARGASSSYFDTPEDKVKNIRKQLDSNSDREKLDAMKRLIAVRLFNSFRTRQLKGGPQSSHRKAGTSPSSSHKSSRTSRHIISKYASLYTYTSCDMQNTSRISLCCLSIPSRRTCPTLIHSSVLWHYEYSPESRYR